MTRANAVHVAVERVDETGWTFLVLRRGYSYRVQMANLEVARGWSKAEMIGPGNVHNYREVSA